MAVSDRIFVVNWTPNQKDVDLQLDRLMKILMLCMLADAAAQLLLNRHGYIINR